MGVHLITCVDGIRPEKQTQNLGAIAVSSEGVGIKFTWEFDEANTIHARHIVTDTGWKIALDRGLDIFQQYELNDAFSFANPPIINDRLLQLFPDAGGRQHDEVKASRDSWLPALLTWKEKVRSINPQAKLHPSVIERFDKTSVAMFDARGSYRPRNLQQHEVVQHFYAD